MISLWHWSWGLFCAVILLFSSSVSATDNGDHWRNRPLKVVTQNLFISGDLDTILEGGSPEDFFQEILRSNPPERLKALAQQIRRERPHVIGLQEVALIRVQEPGDFDFGIVLPNAEDVYLDWVI